MKNYEKYADKIREYDGSNFCDDFIIPNILKSNGLCSDTDCKACQMLCMIWLSEEYKEPEEPEEPETDWSKVEVDTPILVRNIECGEWFKRHFAEYKNGKVYTWDNGYTSWTACGDMGAWRYFKLAESEKEPEELEVDWSKVEVDTPILVKAIDDGKWKKRYFAKYEGGVVYAWDCGKTSWNKDCVASWKYAKLAESEEE